ncbi:hypothetical protein E7W39_04090 [Cronobacter sakazakii]|uniref:hypothetical protein n=1 Tax=Enterobacteriaceae TaxID=543 RepID=UPI0004953C8E|nr:MULTISPECIES: hypothetical protein [Enterobacteriaceae]EGT4277851.1 hypothetical protein [Cronobacter sakazakii]EGT5208842.1 hypothetical protein [Cronobacter sakazakii]EGT5667126.1 hypothetical protein [Cronobacter sakazakii]EGT5755493.1 hypothetical protein [Cronobacter sakazakii]EGZ7002357.1 hypothetical protein [Cronobacter sakazakii]
MLLVFRKSRYRKRELTDKEATAVGNVYRSRMTSTLPDIDLADKVFWEMHNEGLWLQCDCWADHQNVNPPELTAVNDPDIPIHLRNINRETDHADNCPLKGQHTEGGEERTASGARKKASLRRIDYSSLLRKKAIRKQPAGTPDDNDEETRRPRRAAVSSLARLLFTLIEDAGFNELSLPVNLDKPYPGAAERIRQLQAVLDKTSVSRGHMLSEVVSLKPWKSPAEIMATLDKAEWLEGRERLFWMIFTTDRVTEDGAEFVLEGKGKDGNALCFSFSPTRRLRINGEAGEGRRGHYWVIVRFERNEITGQVECRDGYAHAIYSRNWPVPVDSELEKDTLKSINKCAEWLRVNSPAINLTLLKPVHEQQIPDPISDEKGFVIPDFIVNVTENGKPDHTLVIETMGYRTEEYIGRKKKMHRMMKEIGQVVTDPQKWPEPAAKPFEKHLFGVIINR